jgi:DNA repair protein RecN (Recombination protein N)
MQSLGMEGGRFEVEIRPLETPASSGIDDVVFLVAGHAGSAPKPVAKVASGGELSRLSLAIAVTTSELGAAPTLIFDEIDAGIGGVVGDAVGRLMQTLGRHRQVLAVTHLPQVAAHAHHHLRVVKRSGADGRTVSSVETLNATQRVEEVARMLGSDAGSRTSIAHARDLLERAARAEAIAP